jgi:hypothetical protein
MQVLYNGITYNILILIPLKRGIEGIGIDDKDEKKKAGDMNKGVVRHG